MLDALGNNEMVCWYLIGSGSVCLAICIFLAGVLVGRPN